VLISLRLERGLKEALSQLTYWSTAPVAIGANDPYRGGLYALNHGVRQKAAGIVQLIPQFSADNISIQGPTTQTEFV